MRTCQNFSDAFNDLSDVYVLSDWPQSHKGEYLGLMCVLHVYLDPIVV